MHCPAFRDLVTTITTVSGLWESFLKFDNHNLSLRVTHLVAISIGLSCFLGMWPRSSFKKVRLAGDLTRLTANAWCYYLILGIESPRCVSPKFRNFFFPEITCWTPCKRSLRDLAGLFFSAGSSIHLEGPLNLVELNLHEGKVDTPLGLTVIKEEPTSIPQFS